MSSLRAAPRFIIHTMSPHRRRRCYSLANRGDSDNLGRVQLPGGGEQASAEAGAGAHLDLHADTAGSTKSLARAHAPASLPSGSTTPRLHFDARNARDACQSFGTLYSTIEHKRLTLSVKLGSGPLRYGAPS